MKKQSEEDSADGGREVVNRPSMLRASRGSAFVILQALQEHVKFILSPRQGRNSAWPA